MSNQTLPYNDIRRIQLLKRLSIKTRKQTKELDRLIKAYPTYLRTENEICMELNNNGFMIHHGKPGFMDDNGSYQEVEKFDINKYSTTQEGLNALIFSFPSEILSQRRSEFFKKVELYGILIAAIGGVITILSFLNKQIQSFFNH